MHVVHAVTASSLLSFKASSLLSFKANSLLSFKAHVRDYLLNIYKYLQIACLLTCCISLGQLCLLINIVHVTACLPLF